MLSMNLKNRAGLLGAFLLTFALSLSGCRPLGMEDYKQTVRSGLQTMPWPLEIEQLFGDADHFITHWGFDTPGPRQWQTEVYFGGRFQLTMTVETEVDYQKRRIVRTVAPSQFYLFSIGRIKPGPGGGVSSFDSGQWRFGEAEWKKLVAAKGDWSVIGITIGETNPVPNFDKLVEAWRGPRIRVK